MKLVLIMSVLATCFVCSCGKKTENVGELSPEEKQHIAKLVERQAVPLTSRTTVYSAYNYSGFSEWKPAEGEKLIAIDIGFHGYGPGLHLSDLEVLDDVSEKDSEEAIEYEVESFPLTTDGQFKSYDYAEEPGKPFRLLLICPVPKATESIKLRYWDEFLTSNAVPLKATGLALPAPENKSK